MSIRLAIIGANGHFSYIFDGLNELSDVVLSAAAPGCDEENITGLVSNPGAQKHQPKTYDDYRRMLDIEKPDIACVNTYFYMNAAVTQECLERGIHVFSEKPLAITMDSLEAVRKAHKGSGKQLGMMLDYRYNPKFYTAKRLVDSGAIGEPALGYAQKSYKLGTRPDWYKKRETFGGLIPWVGIHAIDWFHYVSGVDYKAVRAYHANLHAPHYDELEDTATCLFDLVNGGSAVMSFDYLRPMGAPTHGDDRLRLVGSRGVIEISDLVGLSLTDDKGTRQMELEKPERGLFADFVYSVINDGKCLLPADEAIEATKTVLIARESADKGVRMEF